MSGNSQATAAALERARRHWGWPSSAGESRARPGCTVAISRERGAGGGAVARRIGALLDWPVYDRELLDQVAEESGLRAELLESIDEKRSRGLLQRLEAFAGVQTMTGAAYARRLAEIMLALSVHGHCVIVGRGAAAFLPRSSTLRVRFVAPRDIRISRIRDRLGLPEAEVLAHVDKVDRDRQAFVRQHFGADVADLQSYDLVVNTARYTDELAAALVADAVRRFEQAESEKAAAGPTPSHDA